MSKPKIATQESRRVVQTVAAGRRREEAAGSGPPGARTNSRRLPPSLPTKGRKPRRANWIVAGLVVAASVIGATGWRLRGHSAAPAAPVPISTPVSPEEALLLRQTAERSNDPAPWRKLADLYLIQEQKFEAVWALQQALQRDPGHAPTLRRLADSLEAAKLVRPAIETLSEVVRRHPADQTARLDLARLYLQAGEGKPAIATLRRAGARLATWSDGLLDLGRAQQLDGDVSGALASYRGHLKLSPDSVDGAIRLARLLLDQGQFDLARRALEHGRLSAPRDPRFPFYLGLSWIPDHGPQDPERAMEHFREALVVAPRHPLPHHYIGLLLARQDRWAEARTHFLQATQADSTYPDPQLQFARSLEKTGDQSGAKEQLGVYYFLKDDPFQAANAFRAMEAVDPKNVQAPRLVSLAYLNLGRNDWAIRETKAALAKHPDDVTLLERLATLDIMTHSRPAAQRACQQWLKLQPGAARAHWLLGRIAQDDLKVPEAIREFEQAVAADPENAEYAAALGNALNDAGGAANLRRAATLLQKASQKNPENATYRHDLGITLQQLGDLDGARRQFLATLDLNPRHSPSYSGLSQLCVRLKEPALGRFFAPLVRDTQDYSRDERRLTRRVGQNPTDPAAHYELARFQMRGLNYAAAQSHLERALELRPGDSEAQAALDQVKRVIAVR